MEALLSPPTLGSFGVASPALPPQEEREKDFFAFVPGVARSEPDWPQQKSFAAGPQPILKQALKDFLRVSHISRLTCLPPLPRDPLLLASRTLPLLSPARF